MKQLEGYVAFETDCTLDDVFRYEIGDDDVPDLDVTEVVNHVAAVRRGLELLDELPCATG